MNVETKVRNIRANIKTYTEAIDSIENILFRKICLFSVTEQFAQDAFREQNSGNSIKFCDFIEKYSGERKLSDLDPVTLFYNFRSDLSEWDEQDELITTICNPCNSPVFYDEKYIEECVSKIKQSLLSKNKCTDKFYKHKYSRLIYKYRSKLMHEFCSPSTEWLDEQEYDKLFYTTKSIITSEDIRPMCELRIPYNFLKRIFLASINAYLDECIEQGNRPFADSKQYLSWYE